MERDRTPSEEAARHPATSETSCMDEKERHRSPTPQDRLELQGRALFVARHGPPAGDGPVLVFLHDGLGSVASMRQFPSRLSETMGLPAFSYDRPGHGHSDPVEQFPDDFMGDAADQLEDILDLAGISRCCLIGHSDGGTIALLHGARYQHRISAIVTIAAHIERDRLTLEQIRRHSEMVAAGEIPGWMHRFHGTKATSLLRSWTSAWQRTFYDYWNIRDEISAVKAPVLALQGRKDAYGLPAQLYGIGEAIGHARVEMIDELGHFPHLEAPASFVDRIANFLAPYCDTDMTAL